jgi:biotin-(acetyl-CoA carboxylase) ligase
MLESWSDRFERRVPERTLNAVGLRLGEPIRFRRHDGGRWIVGKVVRIEADGSITLHDPDGAARSIRPGDVQVRRPAVRGRLVWQAVCDVAVTWEQLELF